MIISKAKLMKILLDTHIFIWWLMKSPHLSNKIVNHIATADEVYVSAISLWEAAIKVKTGKLDADIDQLRTAIANNHFIDLPMTMDHALSYSKLPLLHKDPFDRMLVAQAITEPLRLLTADRRLAEYTSLVDLV